VLKKGRRSACLPHEKPNQNKRVLFNDFVLQASVSSLSINGWGFLSATAY